MNTHSVEEVFVELGERSYPIVIGSGVMATCAQQLVEILPGKQIVVVSNETVFAHFGSTLLDALTAVSPGLQIDHFLMPDGEEYKSLETYGALMEYVLEKRHNRTTTFVALGGGVVGDLTGFVAATYQRGVDFVQIPTTLLAQVDSSVGGKTAVNHPLGKNMIGAFYQPRQVIIDTDTLSTLPAREFGAGLAEVIKYGLIYDADFYAWLLAQQAQLQARDAGVLAQTIKRCCEVKASVVAQDEREGGLRAILNFGHTFGHAIENLSGYGSLLHGEAVAIGMLMATSLSARMGFVEQDLVDELSAWLSAMGLPTKQLSPLASEDMIASMSMDKKSQDGRIRFVLLERIGRCRVTDEYDQQALRAVLEEYTG